MRAPSLLVALALALGGCGPSEPEWVWVLPAGFPAPAVPEENPMSASKVELGRRLFYDKRLSENGSQSCASCHEQQRAFTDGRANAVGSTGEHHRRGSMSLANVAYNSTQTWASGVTRTLGAQALMPLFGETPVELGMAGKEAELLRRLGEDGQYPSMFRRAFPDEAEPMSVANVTRAIAAFQRTLISGNSPYDRWVHGKDEGAVSDAAKRGSELFFSERLDCFHCHGGFNFADSVQHDGTTIPEVQFHNTGLYNLDGAGAYPAIDQGLIELTGRPEDMGRFRAPTLRNIAVTAPYMHDGSIATLDAVLTHYARGGREILEGPNQGLGWQSPLKSEFVHGFSLTDAERADVIAFLESLTDEAFLNDPRHADPFEAP